MRIKEKLQHIIKNSLIKLGVDKKNNEIIIEPSKEENSGDYYTNIAISLSKDLHKKPEEIADILKKIIKDDMIEKIEVTYPGIINIYINKNYLLNGIGEIISKNINYGKNNIGESRKINIQFLNSNLTKKLNLENIFNAIYADNLSRILKYNGFDVTKEIYINDISDEIENFAILVNERYKELCNSNINLPENTYTDILIKDIATNIYRFYNNTKLKENIDYYKKEVINNLLDVKRRDLDNYRINFDFCINEQSLYDNGIVDCVLDKLNRNGHTYLLEDELWLKTMEYNDKQDRRIVKNDGSYSFLLVLIAYQVDRINKKYDGLINIYNKDSNKYIKTIKPVLKMLAQDTNKLQIKELPEITLNENKDIDTFFNEFGINYIRYLFTSTNIESNIDFNLEIIKKDTIENPIYYIEKTNSVIHKILKNYNKKITKVNKFSTIDSNKAYIILNKLYEFEDIVIASGLKQMPHLICNYLFELATLFNEYYRTESIITKDEVYTNERLNLLLAIKIVINNALDLIGIIPREEL